MTRPSKPLSPADLARWRERGIIPPRRPFELYLIVTMALANAALLLAIAWRSM